MLSIALCERPQCQISNTNCEHVRVFRQPRYLGSAVSCATESCKRVVKIGERAGKQTVMSEGELIDLWVTFEIKAPHTLFRKEGANHASADQLQGSPYLFCLALLISDQQTAFSLRLRCVRALQSVEAIERVLRGVNNDRRACRQRRRLVFRLKDRFAASMRYLEAVFCLSVALSFGLTLAACNRPSTSHSTSFKDVQEKYRGEYADLGRRYAAIASKLPPAGSIKKDSAPVTLDPKPFYADQKPKEPSADLSAINTGILSVEELLNPATVPEIRLIPAGVITYPRSGLALVRDNNSSAGNFEDTDGKFERSMRTGLALRYLIVYRVAELIRPTKVAGKGGADAYTPGALKLEVFLVDLKTDEVVASFPVESKTADEIKFTDYYSKYEKVSDNLVRAAVASMEKEVLPKVAATLAKTSGGTFKL